MKEWNGKPVKKWNSAMDQNGNKVGKIFYEDGTTEIVRGGNAAQLPWTSDKNYKSLSGLYGSKQGGQYYVWNERDREIQC